MFFIKIYFIYKISVHKRENLCYNTFKLRKKENENDFIASLSGKLNIPLVGGSAAINQITGKSKLLYGQADAAILLLDDDRYDFIVDFDISSATIVLVNPITNTPTIIGRVT